MIKHEMRNKWTEEHISYLKMAYLKGSSLKQMALKLNRSVTAINKVLARHKLRTHGHMNQLPHLPYPTNEQRHRHKSVGTQIRKKKNQKTWELFSCHREEVSFESVICWLKTQRISVYKSPNDVFYEVNGQPKNEYQILYIANTLREELNLPIFLVKNIPQP